jgi:pimeloyl-ACP methyl ester carboxylesterase
MSQLMNSVLIAAALGFVLPLGIAAKTFWLEYASFDDPGRPVDAARARQAFPGLQEVSWESDGATLRGWFVPGRERAAVILVHGSGGNRDDLLGELEILSRAGFTLLAFDWPGQGESGGRTRWDEPERAAVRSALDWLSARPEVDPSRVGAFGFSLGTVPLLQVAVGDPRLRAVALAGAPIGYEDHIRWDFRKYGLLSQLPGVWADRMRGMRMDAQVPVQIVSRLAPRPLLLILGEDDGIVPPEKTRALFAAAAEPKELLALPGVGHGEYAAKGAIVYADHLTTFFTRALLGSAAADAR